MSIASLKRAGVVFEDYDFLGFKTVDHAYVPGAGKAAEFKDSEGNCLWLHEGPRRSPHSLRSDAHFGGGQRVAPPVAGAHHVTRPMRRQAASRAQA
jgi:hypothetical protein